MGAEASSAQKLEQAELNLRMNVRSIARQIALARKSEQACRAKVRASIARGDVADVVRTHASSAVQQTSTIENLQRLGARLDGVILKVHAARTTTSVAQSIGACVDAMAQACDAMPITQLAEIMDRFEGVSEDLEVRESYVSAAMSVTTAALTPEASVDAVIQRVGDEHGLEIGSLLRSTPTTTLPALPVVPTTAIAVRD